MKYLILSLMTLSCYGLNANNQSSAKAVDCFEFADAVEANDGDSGDFETWFAAFEHCSGVETVVING